jgi:hypothetical protein
VASSKYVRRTAQQIGAAPGLAVIVVINSAENGGRKESGY